MYKFKSLNTQGRYLQGISDPEEALKEAFLSSDEEFNDLEYLLNKHGLESVSMEGEKWDQFKRDVVKIKEGTSKFFKGLVKAGKTTVDVTKKISGRIGDFITNLKNSIQDKVVTEKYIHEKFDKTSAAIENANEMRCYVSRVPEYETLISRVNAIIACANYIKDLASRPDCEDGKTIMEQLALKSKGVVVVKYPKDDEKSSNAHLEWKEAVLETFDVKGSKYANKSDMDKLKNAIIHCKYEAVDDLGTAARTIDKRARQEQADDDAENIGNYALVYTVGKIVKQFYKEAVQKELNLICTVYMNRLTQFKDDK